MEFRIYNGNCDVNSVTNRGLGVINRGLVENTGTPILGDATFGYTFQIQPSTYDSLKIYSLGVNADTWGGDDAKEVAVWITNTQTLLVQARVDKTLPLVNGFYILSLETPVTLVPGLDYTVGILQNTSDFFPLDPQPNVATLVNNVITITNQSFLPGETLTFPTNIVAAPPLLYFVNLYFSVPVK